jgi:hypothetical protein
VKNTNGHAKQMDEFNLMAAFTRRQGNGVDITENVKANMWHVNSILRLRQGVLFFGGTVLLTLHARLRPPPSIEYLQLLKH